MTPTEIAWLAGLFEGEGHIGNTAKGRSENLILSIGMTDRDVIQRVVDITGMGRVDLNQHAAHPKWKPLYRWVISSDRDVSTIINAIGPLLGERRREQIWRAYERRQDYLDTKGRFTTEALATCGETITA